MAIDMKNYAGELESPAAVEQQVYNSYQSNEPEFPVLPPEPVEVAETQIQQQEPVAPQAPQEDQQALNFKALSDSVEKLKGEREAEKREYQLQLDMLRANLSRQPAQEAPKPKKMFDGMEDSDVPNVGELRKAWSERENAYNEKIEELQVANSNPDYAQILGKYGKHLAETDPAFLQGLRGAENKALFAYEYAKNYAERQSEKAELLQLREAMKVNSTPTQTAPSVTAQRIVDNARKPGTLAQAGGQSVLSKADYYATMSDNEFMKMATKHLETI